METVITYTYEVVYNSPCDRWGRTRIRHDEVSLDDFLYSHPVYILKEHLVYDLHVNWARKDWQAFKVTDIDGKIICLSRLIELRLNWEKKKLRERRLRNWRYAYRRQAWRGHRGIFRTTQERRWAAAWDCEEFPPHVRAARRLWSLPNAWDDPMGHNEKCWKFQSKRKHQWKPN